MRRSALLTLGPVLTGLLAGCTGTGVFFDHTMSGFDANPNTPAGNSEMFQYLRGEDAAVTPLVPEKGNIWPGPQKPDPTLQEIEHESGESSQGGGAAGHQQPRGVTSSGQAAPAGPTVDVTGKGKGVRGYRQMQSSPDSPAVPSGKGVLVPNGNGTSTLIGPDGSVSTVPTAH